MVNDCNALSRAIGGLGSVIISLTSLLFLFRIHALYYGQPLVVYPFTAYWATLSILTLAVPFFFGDTHVHPTHYCSFERVGTYGAVGAIAAASYDTMLFVAVTFKLISNSMNNTAKTLSVVLTPHRGMGRISRQLLAGNEQYFMYVI